MAAEQTACCSCGPTSSSWQMATACQHAVSQPARALTNAWCAPFPSAVSSVDICNLRDHARSRPITHGRGWSTAALFRRDDAELAIDNQWICDRDSKLVASPQGPVLDVSAW